MISLAVEADTFFQIYGFAMLTAAIFMLVVGVTERKQMQRYYPYGLGLIVIFLFFELLIRLLVSFNQLSEFLMGRDNLVSLLTLLMLLLCGLVGMHFSNQLGISSQPWIFRRWQPISLEFEHAPANRVWPLIRAGLVGGLIFAFYTLILLKLTKPLYSSGVFSQQELESTFGISQFWFIQVLWVLEAAWVEEIVFRLGLQNAVAMLFKMRGESSYWNAIGIAALVWALAHTTLAIPPWIKYAQIFPIGLALGWMYRKYGLESCMLAHGLFNLLGVIATPWLI